MTASISLLTLPEAHDVPTMIDTFKRNELPHLTGSAEDDIISNAGMGTTNEWVAERRGGVQGVGSGWKC